MLRLFPTGFVSLFSADLTFTSYAVSKSGTYFLMLWVMGIQVVTQNLFLALGNAGLSLFLAFFRKVILLVPLIYVMPGLVSDQVEGVFLAEPIADTIAAFVTIALFILRYQKVLLKKTFKTD